VLLARPVVISVLAVATVSGCGADEPVPDRRAPTAPETREARAPAPLQRARCPAGAGNCRSASGRIVYVEAVDPDGDGDAHFVLAGRDSVTAPGVSVIDVHRDLRPHPFPRVGDRLSAAGPVYRGSRGQRQIEAVEVRVARR